MANYLKVFKSNSDLRLINYFKYFINETKDYPHFSTLYDKDDWNHDYKDIINCLLALKLFIEEFEIYVDREDDSILGCCLGDITGIDYKTLDLVNEAIDFIKQFEKE